MINHRLLTGLLSTVLSGAGVCAFGQAVTVTSLEEIFRTAETNSVQLRPSLTAVEEAERDLSVARSQRLPDINANLSISYIGDGFTTERNYSDYEKAEIPHLGTGLGINVTQPLYTGGAITNGIRMAELKSTAARHTRELARDNIRFRLTGYYLDIYKYSNLRKVVNENISAARLVLKEMQSRYEEGTALRNDITRYELLVSNLEFELIRIDNTLDILNRELTMTAGYPEGTRVVPDSTILDRSLPVSGEAWWQQEATANSPALSLARTGVDMSETAEKLAGADRLPKIGLRAAWTMDGPILVEIPPIDRNLSYWYVGLGVSYDLSSLYKSNKKIAASKVAIKRAREELDATAEDTRLAVRAEYIRYMEAYEELKSRTKSVELANQNYATTSTRYSADMALITDMLDAANSRLDAGQQLVNARINIIYHYYKLLFISGKL